VGGRRAGIGEHCHLAEVWHELEQQLDALQIELRREDADACEVSARPREGWNEPAAQHVVRGDDDGNAGRRALGRNASRVSAAIDNVRARGDDGGGGRTELVDGSSKSALVDGELPRLDEAAQR